MAPDDASGWRSNLERQLAEVEVLRAIYCGHGEFRTSQDEKELLEKLTQQNLDASFSGMQVVSFTVQLPRAELGGWPVKVGFSLPANYPERQAVRVSVECGGSTRRQHHEVINRTARQTAESLVGKESILQVLQTVEVAAREIEESRMEVSLKGSQSCSPLGNFTKVLRRKLIWFHHIKSLQKRKNIIEWGHELQLGGYCKPGFPGILILEGEGNDVTNYVRRLQSLHWQALSVRGEGQEEVTLGQDIDVLRRFSIGIQELNENAMSELGALCREAGLEPLFLSGLKISR